MGFVGRGRWERIIRVAVSSSLAALLLIAGPGGALAQTVAQDQYSEGGVQQAPVGPGDPAYPGVTIPAPSAPPAGGVTSPAPSGVTTPTPSGVTSPAPPPSGLTSPTPPPSGLTSPAPSQGDPSQAPVVPNDPAYPGATTPAPSSAPPGGATTPTPSGVTSPAPGVTSPAPPDVTSGVTSPAPSSAPPADPSQAPVAPNDPSSPGLASQPPQTFGQELADVSTDLNGICQGLAALGQDPAPAAAQAPAAPDPSAAVPAFSAPTTAVVGGASPGQPPVAVVDPYSAATGAVSAVGGGAPGYTTTSGQTLPGVAVLGGVPAGQQAPVAVVDPFSAALGAASPSAPASSQQTVQYLTQHLQQLLWAKQAADYQAQQQQLRLQPYLDHLTRLLAAAAPPAGQIGLGNVTSGSNSSLAPVIAPESNCVNAGLWLSSSAPDGSDLDDFSDTDDVYENCDAMHPDALKLFPQFDPL